MDSHTNLETLPQGPPLFWWAAYQLILLPTILALRLVSRFNSRIRIAFAGREGSFTRLEQATSLRDLTKPLLWFHVASAGELLQAQPVIRRSVSAGCECLLTFSSVNARRWIERQGEEALENVLAAEFLPLDTPANAHRLLGLVQPSRIIWVSYDLWPNLLWTAAKLGIPQSLVSAIVHSGSARETRSWGRAFYRTLYRSLDTILTVSEADMLRIRKCVPEHPVLQVMGDTRCDSVLERRDRLKPLELPDAFRNGIIFVAGSVWPKDEECIFPVLKEALSDFPDLCLVLVPHEPTDAHLKKAESFFSASKPVRWSCRDQARSENRVLLIDTVGLLAGLYRAARLAYVGGGFTTGVHNTMEPAAMGLPVFFGPRHDNALEALLMVEKEIAFTVKNPGEFRTNLRRLLEDSEHCRFLGARASELIESQAGASELCVPFLLRNIN